jgi:hypothetical protein
VEQAFRPALQAVLNWASAPEGTPMIRKDDELTTASDQTWILSSLEHDQLARARKHFIPRRRLRGPELLIIWALRLYLLFMMFVVAYQVWIAHAYR